MKFTTSVALCTYNGEKYLTEQLDSILNQSMSVDEIIVCDDGSTDKTISIVEEYSSKNPHLFSIYRNEKNLKSLKNFQKALSLCTKDIIFLCDQDDLWQKDKVLKILAYLDKNPTMNVVATNGCCINSDQTVDCQKKSVWDIPALLEEQKDSYNYFELISSITNVATGATMAIRKTFVSQAIPFPGYKDFHHDEWIALVASYYSTFSFYNEKLTFYRIHAEQQVGENFFKLSKENLLAITSLYRKSTFKEYKRCLKVVINNYNKKKGIKKANTLSETFEMIINRAISTDLININLINKKMRREYPLQYLLLKASDIFSGKRKID